MRIYNGTNACMDLPLIGSERLSVAPFSTSVDFMATPQFLSNIVVSFTTDELAMIVGGTYELSMCAQVPTVTNYVVQTLDEAIARFQKPEPEPEPVKEEVKEEVQNAEPEAAVEEEKSTTTTKKKTTKKKTSSK